MHPTAMKHAKRFFNNYVNHKHDILEVGSQNVTGSLRDACPSCKSYVGIDMVAANGVDIVLTDPYKFPFEDEKFDVVASSSVFEHSEMHWVLFLEMLRVMKPGGLMYMNAPSNGFVHRYPVDCWRFYPDAGKAFVTWAKYNKIECELLEEYIADAEGDVWNDFVMILRKK
jgi:SAM-dependent methyltransferase